MTIQGPEAAAIKSLITLIFIPVILSTAKSSVFAVRLNVLAANSPVCGTFVMFLYFCNLVI